jgi:transcriptional regulator with XRE-family HTH domain
MEERAAAARSIGRRLAASRERAGLTQLDAARALGIPQSQVAKLEIGIRQLRFVEGLRLAALYGIKPADLDPIIPAGDEALPAS